MFWTVGPSQHCALLLVSNHTTDLLLASLKQVAVVQEEGLHLVDTTGSHKDEVEDGKDPQLEIKRAISNLPKGETTEKSCKYVQVDLVPDIVL